MQEEEHQEGGPASHGATILETHPLNSTISGVYWPLGSEPGAGKKGQKGLRGLSHLGRLEISERQTTRSKNKKGAILNDRRNNEAPT